MQDIYSWRRVIPALATVLGAALFVHLGNWQAAKAELRSAQLQQYHARATLPPVLVTAPVTDAATLQDTPVRVRGHYLTEGQFYLDNQQENGQAGVHVITPLQIEGGTTRVLVDRGWISWGQSRQKLPQVPTPAGDLEIVGVASVPSARKSLFIPDRQEANPLLWSRLDLARYAGLHTEVLQPFVILQNPANATDNLVRNWPEPEDRVAMHRSYSLQWYAMACGLVLFFVVANWRKRVSP